MSTNGLTRVLRREHDAAEADGFLVCVNENDMTIFTVGLSDDMLESYGLHNLRLEVDQWALQAGKPNLVTLEVRFPSSYPAIPPFVRIITPRFQFHTGHITVGGSICAEFLTTGGWKSAEMNLIYILRSVCSLLLEGKARVDPYGFPYSLSEAKEAFQRVASQHGWS